MTKNVLKQGLNAFILFLVAMFLVLALYSAIGQQIFPRISKYQSKLESYISERIDGKIAMAKLWGDMNMLTPSVHIEGLTLHEDDASEIPQLSIAAIDAVLDPRLSILNMTPVFKSVRISGLSLTIDSPDEGGGPTETDGSAIEEVIESLLLQQHVELNGVTVNVNLKDHSTILKLDHLVVSGDGFHRLMTGSFVLGDESSIKADLKLYSEGSPYDLDKFYARGSLEIPDFDVAYWLNKIDPELGVDKFHASAQLNLEFDKGLLQKTKLSVKSPSIKLKELPKISNIDADVWLQQNAQGMWQLWLEKGDFELNNKNQSLKNIGLSLSKKSIGSRWHFYADLINLSGWQKILNDLTLIPKDIAAIIETLAPKGQAEKVNIVLDIQQDESEQENRFKYTAAAELKDIRVNSYSGAPGVKGLNGVVALNNSGGRVQFQSRDFDLNIPNLYEHPLSSLSGEGQIDWHIRDHQIHIVGDGLSLAMENIESIDGGFQVWVSMIDDLESKLSLNLSFNNVNATAHKLVVPNVLDADIMAWLDQAIVAGNVTNGQLILLTSLEESSPDPQLELHLALEKAEVKYLENWPSVSEIEGDLFLNQGNVLAYVPSANNLGGSVSGGAIQVKTNKKGDTQLWVGLTGKGTAQQGFRYFTETPLQQVVSNGLDSWSLKGNHKIDLAINVPLSGESDAINVDIKSHLSSSQLYMGDTDLEFNKVNGVIGYSSQRGLYSDNLKLQMWEQPLDITAQSQFPSGDLVTTFSFAGGLNMSGAKEWLKLGLLESVQGISQITGQFILDTRAKQPSQLMVNSHLEGIDINLPAPFGKEKKSAKAFDFKVLLSQEQDIYLTYDDVANVAIELKEGNLYSGQVYLGQTEAYIPEEPGMFIQGHIDTVNIEQWQKTWEKIQAQNKQYEKNAANSSSAKKSTDNDPEESTPIREIAISADLITYGDHRFVNVDANLTHDEEDGWLLNLNAPVAKGVLLATPGKPIDVKLDYFHWPALDEKEEEDDIDPLANLDPRGFPDINLVVDEIFLGPTNFGHWKLSARPFDGGIIFGGIAGEIKKLKVKGEIAWHKTKEQYTTAALVLTSQDVAGIQKAWRIKPSIEAKKAKVNLGIQWLGSPAGFNVKSLSGDASFKLESGGFVDAGEASALNVFGILNVGAIVRRLTLDFSDLYQSGLHFDIFKSKTKIDDGVISIVDTLLIEGPAAKFEASGTINLNNKELNQQLSATFPVTSTLPLVAILAGFAPPVAVSVFVGEKIVGDEISKFTSATYTVRGTWEDPELKLNKRFDNEIDGRKSKSFWFKMKDIFGLGKD